MKGCGKSGKLRAKGGTEGSRGEGEQTLFFMQSLVSNGAKLEMHFLCSHGVQRNKFTRRQIAHVYRFVMLYKQHMHTLLATPHTDI